MKKLFISTAALLLIHTATAKPFPENFSNKLKTIKSSQHPCILIRNNSNENGLLLNLRLYPNQQSMKTNHAILWATPSILKDTSSYNTYPYIQCVNNYSKSEARFVLNFDLTGEKTDKEIVLQPGIYNVCSQTPKDNYADSAILNPGDEDYRTLCG